MRCSDDIFDDNFFVAFVYTQHLNPDSPLYIDGPVTDLNKQRLPSYFRLELAIHNCAFRTNDCDTFGSILTYPRWGHKISPEAVEVRRPCRSDVRVKKLEIDLKPSNLWVFRHKERKPSAKEFVLQLQHPTMDANPRREGLLSGPLIIILTPLCFWKQIFCLVHAVTQFGAVHGKYQIRDTCTGVGNRPSTPQSSALTDQRA